MTADTAVGTVRTYARIQKVCFYGGMLGLLIVMALLLAGCGGGGGSTSSGGGSASKSFTIGGTISGLLGSVVLQNNGGNNLTRSANGLYSFSTSIATGRTYSVTVLTQPANQICTVTNGSGTVGTSNVTKIPTGPSGGTSTAPWTFLA